MKRQLKVEIFKIFHSVPMLVIFLFFSLMGVLNGLIKFIPSGLTGYEAYIGVLTDTSLIFILSLSVSIFIASDFNDRTIQNEIKLGNSRKSAVVCRAIVALPVSGIIHIIYAAIGAILAGAANGFALEIPLLSIKGWSLLVFLEMIAIQSVVVFIVFLCRKVTSSIAVSVCTMVVLCNALRNLTDGAVFVQLFNMTCFSRMAMNMQAFSMSDILITMISALITIAVFVIGSVAAFQKAEVE